MWMFSCKLNMAFNQIKRLEKYEYFKLPYKNWVLAHLAVITLVLLKTNENAKQYELVHLFVTTE